MYAIVQQGGHQYRVAPGDRLLVDQLTAEVGDVVSLAPVLVVQNDAGTTVGTPVVDGARVAAVVIAHRRGTKLRVFKYKPKKRYRRTQGHRSRLTELRIEALLDKGQPLPKAAAAPATKEPSPKATVTGRAQAKAKAAPPAAQAVTDDAPVKRSAPRTPKAAPADVVAGTPEAKAGGAKRTRKTAKPGEEA